jgi:hypothetical protein
LEDEAVPCSAGGGLADRWQDAAAHVFDMRKHDS